MKVLFSVDRTVGSGAHNDRRDVELVQFLLRAASRSVGGLPGVSPAGYGPIKIDGLCGPQTIAYIRHYQTGTQALVSPSLVDGKVSPIRNGSLVGSIHGKVLAIAHLNGSYAKRYGAERHLRMDRDPEFPRSLREALYT
jgi:hypothetical protein